MIDIIYYEKNIVKKAEFKQLKEIKDKHLWIDITQITSQEKEELQEIFELHPLTSEDLLSQNIRIKVEDFEHYLFCVFYGIKKAKPVELLEIDYILGKNYIITNHKKPIQSFEELKKDNQRLEKNFKKETDLFFHRLIDLEIDNYFPVLEKLDDLIEEIEEQVTKNPKPELLQKILKIKRTINLIKRHTLPQREKISYLAKQEYKLINKKSIPYFRDIYDHAIRVSDTIDNYREAIGGTFDAYMSSLSNNMNEVMKVLSIIATIALPLTVISGIYGTNFTALPGSGFSYGFWTMIIAMILMALGMLYFFRKRGWF